jgi:hypothetical protein
MGAVKIGEIKHPDAAVIRAAEDRLASRLAELRKIGVAEAGLHAGAHANAAHPQRSVAKGHQLVGIKIAGFGFLGEGQPGAKQHATQTQRRLLQKLASFDFHGRRDYPGFTMAEKGRFSSENNQSSGTTNGTKTRADF